MNEDRKKGYLQHRGWEEPRKCNLIVVKYQTNFNVYTKENCWRLHWAALGVAVWHTWQYKNGQRRSYNVVAANFIKDLAISTRYKKPHISSSESDVINRWTTATIQITNQGNVEDP